MRAEDEAAAYERARQRIADKARENYRLQQQHPLMQALNAHGELLRQLAEITEVLHEPTDDDRRLAHRRDTALLVLIGSITVAAVLATIVGLVNWPGPTFAVETAIFFIWWIARGVRAHRRH